MTLQEIATVTNCRLKIEFDSREESPWQAEFIDLYFEDENKDFDADNVKCKAIGKTLKESLAVLAYKMKNKEVSKRWESKNIKLPKVITYTDPEINTEEN